MLFEFLHSNNESPSSNSEQSVSIDREVTTYEIAPNNGIKIPKRGTIGSKNDIKIPNSGANFVEIEQFLKDSCTSKKKFYGNKSLEKQRSEIMAELKERKERKIPCVFNQSQHLQRRAFEERNKVNIGTVFKTQKRLLCLVQALENLTQINEVVDQNMLNKICYLIASESCTGYENEKQKKKDYNADMQRAMNSMRHPHRGNFSCEIGYRTLSLLGYKVSKLRNDEKMFLNIFAKDQNFHSFFIHEGNAIGGHYTCLNKEATNENLFLFYDGSKTSCVPKLVRLQNLGAFLKNKNVAVVWKTEVEYSTNISISNRFKEKKNEFLLDSILKQTIKKGKKYFLQSHKYYKGTETRKVYVKKTADFFSCEESKLWEIIKKIDPSTKIEIKRKEQKKNNSPREKSKNDDLKPSEKISKNKGKKIDETKVINLDHDSKKCLVKKLKGVSRTYASKIIDLRPLSKNIEKLQDFPCFKLKNLEHWKKEGFQIKIDNCEENLIEKFWGQAQKKQNERQDKNTQSQREKRKNETAAQKEERQKQDRENKKRNRENESHAEKAKRLKKKNQGMKRKRDDETSNQKEKRQKEDRENKKRNRENESHAEKAKRLKKNNQGMKQKRDDETSDQKEKRQKEDRENKKRNRENESHAEKAKRLKKRIKE